jgi:hypothetical protein
VYDDDVMSSGASDVSAEAKKRRLYYQEIAIVCRHCMSCVGTHICTLGSLLRLMHFFSSCNFMRCGRSTQMYSTHLPLHISLKSIQMWRLY